MWRYLQSNYNVSDSWTKQLKDTWSGIIPNFTLFVLQHTHVLISFVNLSLDACDTSVIKKIISNWSAFLMYLKKKMKKKIYFKTLGEFWML